MMMIMTNLHMAETLNRIKLGKTSQLAPLLSILLSVREVMGLIPGLVKPDTVSQWLTTAAIFHESYEVNMGPATHYTLGHNTKSTV